MKIKPTNNYIPILLLIILILVWSSVWSLFKFVVEEIPPFSFRVIIGLPASLFLFLLAFKKCKKISVPKKDWKSLFLISIFNVTLWQVLMLYGIGMLGGGRAAVLTYTMPVWATIFATVFGYEKINFSIIIALILGMFGIFCLSIEIIAKLFFLASITFSNTFLTSICTSPSSVGALSISILAAP